MTYRVLFFFAVLAAVGALGVAHPDHNRKMEASPDKAVPEALEIDYYLELFSRIVYDAPMPLQSAMCDHLVELYHHQQSWFQEKDFSRLAEANGRLYRKAVSGLYVLSLKWTDGELTAEKTPPLALTAGLPRSILIAVANDTQTTGTFSVASPMAVRPPMAAFEIAPGRSRIFLVTIQTAAAGSTAVPISVAFNQDPAARTFQLPADSTEPAVITGTLIDSDIKAEFPGKVYVLGSDGMYRFDPLHLNNTTLSEKPVIEHLPIGKDYRLPFFYCGGRFTVRVPAGLVTVTLERGFEHQIVHKTLSAEAGKTYTMELSGGRFIDMKAMGWVCGDTHIHWVKNWWSENEDINLLALVQRAEDIHIANNLTLLQYRPDEQGGVFIKPDHFPMGPVPGYCDQQYHIQMAEEYRNDNFYGHLNFLNIKELIYPIATGKGSGGPEGALDYPLNKTAIEECHRQGGISIEAHNLGPFNRSDVPANVINGLSDSLDQLKPDNYYRFLDCGIQVPITNGSDHPARIAGSARAYVKVDGAFSYEKWIDGIRKKRTFATSGPLLMFTLNGRNIGAAIDARKGDTITIRASVFSRFPIGRFQVVSNGGQVLYSVETEQTAAEIRVDYLLDQSRWFAVRCSQNDNYSSLDNPNAAHSSAIYVNMDGKPVCVPEAVQFWVELLKAHGKNVKDNAVFSEDRQRQEQLDYLQLSIDKYLEKLQ